MTIDDQTAFNLALSNGIGYPMTESDFAKIPTEDFLKSAQADTFKTPSSVSAELKSFALRLSPKFDPRFIEIQPSLIENARRGFCHDNARRCAEKQGGTFQNGWALYVHSGIAMRAIHHCVYWNGNACIDVSPNPFDKSTLFLPTNLPGTEDAVMPNQWGYVPSFYEDLSDDPLVLKIVQLRRKTATLHGMSKEWNDLISAIYDLTALYRKKEQRIRERQANQEERAQKRKLRKAKRKQARSNR